MIDATLVVLLKGHPVSDVLLGYKKIGFGQGKFGGFGGKIEPGEGIAEAALRELTEETGVSVPEDTPFEQVATLEFYFPYKPEWSQRVHVFVTHHWQGIPTESNEMIPQWFPVDSLPYNRMWDDSHYWLPKVLVGEKFHARFTFIAYSAFPSPNL
jgi:8-oxo-dGTP pyrophosphatase MutT (NUDIX family)